MTREARLKYIGVVFYLFLVANILLMPQMRRLIGCTPGITPQALLAAIGLGFALLTSEAMGYLLGTVALVWWERRWLFWGKRRGWSGFCRFLGIKKMVLDEYSSILQGDSSVSDSDREARTRRIEEWFNVDDAFFSFFGGASAEAVVRMG